MALHLLQYSDVENAFDEPARVARLAGGIGARREALASGDDVVLVVGTGDVFGPGVLALETAGAHALSLFEAVEPVAETLGNHDFDHGAERARELVAAAPHEFVVANAFESEAEGAERFAADATVPWTIVERGSTRVGFVGAASPDTGEMAPGAAEVDFRDPVPFVREALAELRERGVDHTVVLGHLGEPLGEDVAADLDADVVLDGHRHEPHADRFDGTAYARPGNGARRFVHATLGEDGETDGGVRTELVETADAPVDDAFAATVREEFATMGLDEVVATVEDPIPCDEAATNVAESRVGNFVTDAYRWHADADVAAMAPGGIRTRDALAGDLTRADLVGLVPFDNELLTCEVDGGTLRAVLESTTMHRHFADDHRKFGHYAGVRVVWDDVATEFESIEVDGAALDVDATYRLASTDYFVDTDHIYPELSPESVVERHGPQYDALVAYAREFGIDAEVEGRVRRPRSES